MAGAGINDFCFDKQYKDQDLRGQLKDGLCLFEWVIWLMVGDAF